VAYVALVGDRLICPICQKTGFVRLEREIKGGVTRTVGHCGACDNFWMTTDDGRPTRSISLGVDAVTGRSRTSE
jgi:hypothetical protein